MDCISTRPVYVYCFWSRCHQKGRAQEAARVAATASLKRSTRVGSGDGTRYAKWVAMAGRQFGRPAFMRASMGWLGGLRSADYYLNMGSREPGGTGSFQIDQELIATNVEHGLPSGVDVRRWGGSGQCVEAALREQVLEMTHTLMQWIATISKSMGDGVRTKTPDSQTSTRAGGRAGELSAQLVFHNGSL